MKLVDVTVYHLEMLAPRQRTVPAPRAGLTVVRAQTPSVPFYRELYDAVGKDFNWLSRRNTPDNALAAIIGDARVEVQVLYVDGRTAGFAELDRRQANEIELAQFGLMPEFIGQGLGKWFLQWTLEQAWSYRPSRFWLHTCTLDHPAALPNYLQAGFAICQQQPLRREL